MDPQILTFLLLVAGFALIFAELFLPSGGMIALMCAGCFAGSIYFAYRAWYGSDPTYWWSYVASVAILIPAGIWGAVHLLTRTSFGNRVLLSAPSKDEVTPYQEEADFLSSLIGKRGKALNLMTPGGLVEVDRQRLHAIADELMIDSDTEVEIVAVKGTRVVVRPVTEFGPPTELASDAEDLQETAGDDVDPFEAESA